jgi:anti-sigma regulatory factor (Ser/Thr protein kinase)
MPEHVAPVLLVRRPAHASELAPLRRMVEACLAAAVPQEEIARVALVINEAVTNTIEHAYGPVDGWFEVRLNASAGSIEICVLDGGRWRSKAHDAGGRGLTLIGRLMDEFEVRRAPAGTEVWMRRAYAGKELSV